MKRVCTILARGGSKGLPGKNVRPLLGKPLIAHTIEQARDTGMFAAIAVSSDSETILATAKEWGAEHLIHRPVEMATSEASKLPPIIHCAQSVEEAMGERFDIVVDLDVTAPLRTAEDITGAIKLLERENVTSVITGAVARKSPYFNLVERRPDGTVGLSKPPASRIVRRQDSPECFDMNAAVYVWKRDPFFDAPEVFFPDTLLLEMPAERSHDIDTPLDFEIVELIMKNGIPS